MNSNPAPPPIIPLTGIPKTSNNNSTKFWIEEPCILFTDLVFFPTAEMTKEQKLNALTRLAIVIALGMYAMEYKHWLTFLLGALLVIIIMQYGSKVKDKLTSQENFTVVPTRIDDEFQTTVVAPLFAEEHRIPPPAYDMYTNLIFPEPNIQEPIRPQAYPYGQYLTKTNLLPSDEYYIQMNPTGGARTAREYANSYFLKNDLAFRENMMRVYRKKLNRRFRNNTQDTWSPFHSY